MRCATKALLPFHRLMSLMIVFERESRLQPFIISSEARVSVRGQTLGFRTRVLVQ